MAYGRYDQAVPASDSALMDYADGMLLHELGHRRDRWLLTPHDLVAILALPAMVVLFVFGGVQYLRGAWESAMSAPLAALVLVSGAIFLLLQRLAGSVRWRAWLEDRADDFAADAGGLDGIDEMLFIAQLDRSYNLAGGVYRPALERRTRQWQRTRGQAPPELTRTVTDDGRECWRR